MSLAEIFLLLVFTVLLVAAHREKTNGPIEVERLRQDVRRLDSANASLTHRIDSLEQSLDRKNAIIAALATMSSVSIEAPEDIPGAIAALKRGAKACTNPNTLVVVRAAAKRLTFRALIDVSAFTVPSGGETISVKEGMVIVEPNLINALLREVRTYGAAAQNNCRFDYRLEFETAEDYLVARDSLERFMYPERIVRVPQ
jgi:hypothetical protein